MVSGETAAIYTADELARSIGLSQRTIYSYLSQGLLSEGRRIGRQVFYGTLHLQQGLLIRALADGGMGLDAIRRVLERLNVSEVQTFVAPLTALVETRSRLEGELATAVRQLRPATDDLDLHHMGLDDPVALRARISAWEGELQNLGRQLDSTFSAVRARILESSTKGPVRSDISSYTPDLAGLREDIQGLTAAIHELSAVVVNAIPRDVELSAVPDLKHGAAIQDANRRRCG